MIHPNTELKFINDQIGYGVFANRDIPKGTIVYVKDSLELEISPELYASHSPAMQDQIEKYAYVDERGFYIVSWDFAKFVNHCCDCNTISTGYGFEIAIRDIKAGEQITDEYGIFNLEYEMHLSCSNQKCRKTIRPSDFDLYYQDWDRSIRQAIPEMFKLDQPLFQFLSQEIQIQLEELKENPDSYKSVYALRHRKLNSVPKNQDLT